MHFIAVIGSRTSKEKKVFQCISALSCFLSDDGKQNEEINVMCYQSLEL